MYRWPGRRTFRWYWRWLPDPALRFIHRKLGFRDDEQVIHIDSTSSYTLNFQELAQAFDALTTPTQEASDEGDTHAQ